MKKLFAFLFLFQALIVSAQFQKNFIDENYIELTGSSQLEITPNEIYLNIVINEANKKLKLSVEKQEALMINELNKNNIKLEENFRVKDFTSSYKYYFFKQTDIHKSKTYELKVSTSKELGKVYESLEKIGISNITITKVDHTEIEDFKLETKVKAIKMAKTKANKYAGAIGQTIGKAIHIQEQNVNTTQNFNQLNEVVIRGAGSISKSKKFNFENLEFSNIIINAKVHVKFQLK